MAITPCVPCNCIPGTIGNDKFKSDVENILCSILAAVSSGSVDQDVNLVGINGVAPSAGNGTTNAGTLRVTISSDSTGTLAVTQSGSWTVAATQSGTWNINNISGTISLPTGAATAANQATAITSLQLLDDVVATIGSAVLTKAYQIAGSDGTNARLISVTSAGLVNIADGGGSITVDGTVAATQSGTWNINNISGTISLPTGASTAANQSTLITLVTTSNSHLSNIESSTANIDTSTANMDINLSLLSGTVENDERSGVDGQLMVGWSSGGPGHFYSPAINSSGQVSINAASGAIASGAIASGAIASGALASGSIVAGAVAAGATSFVKLEDAASANGDAGVPAMAIQQSTPADTAANADYVMLQMSGGKLWVQGTQAEDAAHVSADIGSYILAVIQNTLAASAADGDYGSVKTDSVGATWTRDRNSTTPSQSSVASSATNVTILSSNVNRLGATIFNDSTQVLYLKLGATASTSSYTVQLASNAYYEVPFSYTGQIDGIWASANGNARITELT